MTLILSVAGPIGVVQVSDRLTSFVSGGRRRPHDPLANKTVLFLAKDAVAALSYTGKAYLDGIPTDQWMAERIRGDCKRTHPARGTSSFAECRCPHKPCLWCRPYSTFRLLYRSRR